MPPVPQGQWSLPPEQHILRPDETPFSLHRVARELTVIISTSVGEFTPSTDKVVAALESLQANVALRWCRKILVFDRVPSRGELEALKRNRKAYCDDVKGLKWEKLWSEKREAYDEYCETLRSMQEAGHPAMFKVELVFLEKFGHLFGTVKQALEMVATSYILVTQHDLRLAPRIAAADVQNILEALHSGGAKYVVLNRDVNSAPRTEGYFRIVHGSSLRDETKRPAGLTLTAIAGFSDQTHFATTSWYRREVISAIAPERQLTCMEHVLHEWWKADEEWRGTFLYGGRDEGPFVYDTIHGVQVKGPDGRVLGIQSMPDRSVPA